MPNEFEFDGRAVVSAAETRPDDPPATAEGLVVRPVSSASAPIFVEPVPAVHSVVTAVAASLAEVVLLAASPTRLGFSISNTSATDTLFVLAQPTGVTSLALYTVKVRPGSYYEDPYHYVGEVRGIWDPAATGAAMVTEYRP